MTEVTDTPTGEAEGIDTSSQVDANTAIADDTTAQQTGADEAGQADDTGDAAEQPKRVPWFQKRIDEVTAQKYEAAREAAYWRGIAEGGGRQQAQPQQPANDGPPREDQFASFDDYDEARIAYRVKQELAFERQSQQRETVARTFEERTAKFRAEKPDFDDVVGNPSLRITPLMAQVIQQRDMGPQLAYHLGTNPSEAARIASLPQELQATELGMLEASLKTPAAPSNKPIPPNPPLTVGAVSAGLSKKAEDMSMAEYIAARNAGQI